MSLGEFSLVEIIGIVTRIKPNSDPGYVSQSERKHGATVFIIYYYCSRIVIDANFPRPSDRLFNAIIIIILIFFIKFHYNYVAR